MKFKPLENDSVAVLPNGKRKYTILNAEEAVSKSGNEMLKLTVELFNDEAKQVILFDYLLGFKLKNFCSANGLTERYNAGELLADECKHKSGYVEIAIEKGKPNDNGGNFPDRSVIKKYLKSDVTVNDFIHEIVNDFIDENVPF